MNRIDLHDNPKDYINKSPMVDSPIAQKTWIKTPYLCLLRPKHCSLMNEQHKVMAGFAPKPAKKYPIPIILGEVANAANATPIVQIIHDALIAILLPQLSAKQGITKKPNKLPTKIMEVRTVVIPLN